MDRKKLLILFVFLFVMAACASAPPDGNNARGNEAANDAAPAQPTDTLEPTEVPPTETPAPTSTPAPPTATPLVEDPGDSALTHFVIVPDSSAQYTVEEEFFEGAVRPLRVDEGPNTAVGVTSEVTGELYLDLSGDTPILGPNKFVVNIFSLTSDNELRDEKIQNEFLQSRQYPLAVFVATDIQGFPASYTDGEEFTFQLVGEMTIRDVTNPMTLDVTATFDGQTLSGQAAASLLMVDYGFNPPAISIVLTGVKILEVFDGVELLIVFTMEVQE